MINLPSFYQDEFYKPTQEYMFDFGKKLIEGDIPEFYKPIAEKGGKEFDDILRLTTRDTQKAVEESAVRAGRGRGGAVKSAVAKSVADTSSRLRWNDYLRSLEGKKFFFPYGPGSIEGVRTAGLTNQSQRNQFNLGVGQLALEDAKLDMMAEQEEPSLWKSLISEGLAAAGTLAGAYFGGPVGASVGGTVGKKLGSAAVGGYGSGASAISFGSKYFDLDKIYPMY